MACLFFFFLPNSSIGELCEDLNEIVGKGIYYDRFEIQNTKWQYGYSHKIDKTLCACFGIYPSLVAGILNSARRINYFELCNEELNYENIL